MDPSTTLVTFLLQTHPSVQSVNLIGSWDNFSTGYPMDRDLRRGKGQWKGCHTFRDIICDEDLSRTRDGGLTMGNTYYYYYEVDGNTETHDPSMPSTNACPYLPGQTVNSLTVPSQQNLRQRSASLTSMRITDYQALDPAAKFLPPQPTLTSPTDPVSLRKKTAPATLRNAASSRSLSPAPAWKKLFSSKGREDDRGRSRDRDDQSGSSASTCDCDRSAGSSRSRNRSISPESLRRFLSDDQPGRPGSNIGERPALVIPEDIAEENEDDDNFATSAVSETQLYYTRLSPPPAHRPTSSETVPLTIKNLSSLTLTTERPTSRRPTAVHSGYSADLAEPASQPQSSYLTSATSSDLISPESAGTAESETLTFYDDSVDDDDCTSTSAHDAQALPIQQFPALRSRLTGYSLPRVHEAEEPQQLKHRPTFGRKDGPRFLASVDTSLYPTSSAHYLPTPADTGVDDFVAEMGWMVDSIGTR